MKTQTTKAQRLNRTNRTVAPKFPDIEVIEVSDRTEKSKAARITEKADSALAKTAKPEVVKYDPAPLLGALQTLAAQVAAINKESAPQLWDTVKRMEELSKEYVESVKGYVKELVVNEGKNATDAGTKRLVRNGYELEVQPMGGGYVDEKVESLIRAKNIAPLLAMDSTITYKTNEGKLKDLIAKGKLTEDELETCRAPKGWKVMGPKKVQ